MPAPPVSHLLETSLYVADLDRSRQFYQLVFGFDCLMQDHRMCVLAVPGSSVLLLFREGGSVTPSAVADGVIPPHGASGATHLCFAIPVARLDDWTAHLAALGVALESRLRQSFNGISLYFRDPDGHLVEVATPGIWAVY
jgi:catechol 2,3-dioxygenase-like lactoylglutathione lyase family enzyme